MWSSAVLIDAKLATASPAMVAASRMTMRKPRPSLSLIVMRTLGLLSTGSLVRRASSMQLVSRNQIAHRTAIRIGPLSVFAARENSLEIDDDDEVGAALADAADELRAPAHADA